MKKQLIKEFNNEELLKEICESYDCELEIKDNKIICKTEDGEVFTYNNLEEALIDWLDTLTESEMCYIEAKSGITWLPEIDYIKEIKTKLLFNDKTDLNQLLTYGQIPQSLYKQLSVFIDSQKRFVNDFIENRNINKSNVKTKEILLPVEFVLFGNNIKYLKIANEEFLERLILHNDTSEIDFLEQSIYVKDECIKKVTFTPLLPSNKVTKFEINIPVVIDISPNSIKIKTPIKYVELF